MRPDVIDEANEKAQAFLDAAVEERRRAAAPERVPDENGVIDPDCEDCGEAIEPERLAMGRCRCITCQTELERRNKLYAR